MNSDLFKEAFDEMASDVPVPDFVERVPLLTRRGRRRRIALPVIAAVAVAAVVAGSLAVNAASHPTTSRTLDGTGSLSGVLSPPKSIPSVLQHPIGRAGLLVGIGDPRAFVVVSLDGGTYRSLPRSAYPSAVFALSPDGSRVAYGGGASPKASAIHVLDLGSGHVSSYPLPGHGNGEAVSGLVWSPDGSKIAYSASYITHVTANGAEGQGVDEAILDLATDHRTTLSGRPLTWSADGQQLLLEQDDPTAFTMTIADANGHTVSTIPADATADTKLTLFRDWSSSSHLIATTVREDTTNTPASDPHRYAFELLSDSTGQPISRRIELGTFTGPCAIAGWQDTSHVILSEPLTNHTLRLISLDVSDGTSVTLTQTTPGSDITSIQAAAAYAD